MKTIEEIINYGMFPFASAMEAMEVFEYEKGEVESALCEQREKNNHE